MTIQDAKTISDEIEKGAKKIVFELFRIEKIMSTEQQKQQGFIWTPLPGKSLHFQGRAMIKMEKKISLQADSPLSHACEHDDAILNSHDTTAVQCAQGSILS